MAENEQDTSQERTEPASQKKRDDARRRGKVVRSVEMNSALVLVFGLLILWFGGQALFTGMAGVAREAFVSAGSAEITQASAHRMITRCIGTIGMLIAPLVLGFMLVGLASGVAQTGFLFTMEPLQPKWDRLNPLSGFRRLFFSRRAAVETAKNLLKVAVVGTVGYWAVDGLLEDTMTLADADTAAVLTAMARGAVAVGLKTGLAYLALALADYLYQRFEHERELRMSRQEVKEEMKSQEGDPLIKSRIRSVARQIAYKRMMHDVPKADVVVTNPTHLAIAIRYEAEKMSAPRVVAKGADLIAQRIREIAAEHDVPLVEDKPLARVLYSSVDVGEEIPANLFQAVAQILAHVYRLKQLAAGGGIG
jgi:flagellar biosynthesis protein FlhB